MTHCSDGLPGPGAPRRTAIDAGTNVVLAAMHIGRTFRLMNKRIVFAIGLWFYAGWTLGALVTEALALHPISGPLLGAVAAATFVVAPSGLLVRERI